MQVSWMGDKADALADAIAGLGQTATRAAADIVPITRDKMKARKHLPRRAWAVVRRMRIPAYFDSRVSVHSSVISSS